MIKDTIIDDLGDLIFENGDFKIADSNEQHVVLLINTMSGAWKQFPTVGVGIIQYSASSGQTIKLQREILFQLSNDGYRNTNVILSQNGNSYEYYINSTRPI
jgi:hypothetical protein